jgi:hypothetical protein
VSSVVVCAYCQTQFFLSFLQAEGVTACENCGALLPLDSAQPEEELHARCLEMSEADFLGRTMAHAYMTELHNIEKRAFRRHEKGK